MAAERDARRAAAAPPPPWPAIDPGLLEEGRAKLIAQRLGRLGRKKIAA